MQIEFSGGLESAFENQRTLQLDAGSRPVVLQSVVDQLAERIRKQHGDLSYFLQDGLVRPGILVLINDVDWELLDREETVLTDKDVVHFNSTLHGG